MTIKLTISNDSDSFGVEVRVLSPSVECKECHHPSPERIEVRETLLARDSHTVILTHGQTLELTPLTNSGLPTAQY